MNNEPGAKGKTLAVPCLWEGWRTLSPLTFTETLANRRCR